MLNNEFSHLHAVSVEKALPSAFPCFHFNSRTIAATKKKQRPQVFTINQTNIEAFEALSGLKNNCLKGCQRKCQPKQEKIYAIAPETNAIKSRPIKTAQNTLA